MGRTLPGTLIAAAASAALFLGLAAPGLMEVGVNGTEALQAVEALRFAYPEVQERTPGMAMGTMAGGRLPWMSLPYVGAPGVYLYAAAYRLAGPRPWLVRGVNVALGAAALVFTVLLAGLLYGSGTAFWLGLLLACDPALVLMSRYNYGPSMVSVALKMAGLFALAHGAGRRSRPWLAAGGLLFGVALWDKAHFLWFLASALPAALLFIPRLHWPRLRDSAWAAAGFVLGALPFFLYNAVTAMDTFKPKQAYLAGSWSAVWQNLPELLHHRSLAALALLDGSAFLRLVQNAPLADPLWTWLVAALALLACEAGWSAGAEGLRRAGFWAACAAGVFAAAAVNPYNVNFHHYPMLYPFPHLALAALVGTAAARAGAGRVWKTLACAALLLGAARGVTLQAAHRDWAVSRGVDVLWDPGFETLARWLEADGGNVVAVDKMLAYPLVIYSEGRLPVAAGPSRRDAPKNFEAPGALVVAFNLETEQGRHDAPAREFRQGQAEGRYPGMVRELQLFRAGGGGPWVDVYRQR